MPEYVHAWRPNVDVRIIIFSTTLFTEQVSQSNPEFTDIVSLNSRLTLVIPFEILF